LFRYTVYFVVCLYCLFKNYIQAEAGYGAGRNEYFSVEQVAFSYYRKIILQLLGKQRKTGQVILKSSDEFQDAGMRTKKSKHDKKRTGRN